MKRTYFIPGLSAIALCGALACTFASNGSVTTLTAQSAPPETAAQSTPPGTDGKVLVVYFSVPETDGVDASSGASRLITDGKVTGSTQYIASLIGEATDGDLFEIKTVTPYPGSHKALVDAAKEEAGRKDRPKLATHIKDLKDYDIVFIGFPNWWYDMPMPLYTFFEEYDFSGKTIIPFCTHGGSRFSGAIRTIRELEKGAKVLDGYSIYRDQVADAKEDVQKWLDKIGIRK